MRTRGAALVLLLLVGQGGWSRSRSEALAGVVLPPSEPGDLHILSIGIDDYDRFKTQYSKADAEAVAAVLARMGSRIHPRVFTRVLLDREATREGVEEAFAQLIQTVTPDDTFVFFFAGMGHNPSGEFLLLTHGGSHLDGTALKSRFRQVQARNKLIVVDSCYGALFFEETVAAAALEGGARNASATGANLMLLGTDGLAWESPQLGHGVLTMALLEGLGTKGDLGREGRISVRELEAYLPHRLYEVSVGAGAPPVRPRSSTLGQDFDIGIPGGDLTRDWRGPALRLLGASASAGALTVPAGPTPLKGRATDLSGLAKVTVNGVEVPVTSDGSFAATVTVGPAPSSLEIVAVDREKNATSLALTLQGSAPSRGPASGDLGPARGARPVPGDTGSPPVARRDYAILFATDEYDAWTRLQNPTFDADEIADRLRGTYGFDVKVVRNPDSATVLDTVMEYQQRAYGPDDQLLIFVAGHGFFDERWSDGFLVSRNSPSRITSTNFGSFLQHATLFRMIDTIRCAHILLVLDACFGGQMLETAPLVPVASGRSQGPFTAPWARGAPLASPIRAMWRAPWSAQAAATAPPTYPEVGDDELVRRKLRGKSRKLLTSGGKEYVPDGRPGFHSPFASRFIEALASRGGEDRVLTTDELFGFVERVVPEPRRGRFTADSVGDFVFVARGPR